MKKIISIDNGTKEHENLCRKSAIACENARGRLVMHHPFIGRLSLHMAFVPVKDTRITTIATNGKTIYYNPEWLCKLPPVTMVGTIAHTIWTGALCHPIRLGSFDRAKFDAASDVEVYTLLRAEKVPMCLKPDFADDFPKHLPVEEIAEKLSSGGTRHRDADVHLYNDEVLYPQSMPVEESSDIEKNDDEKTAPEKESSVETQQEAAACSETEEKSLQENGEEKGASSGNAAKNERDAEKDARKENTAQTVAGHAREEEFDSQVDLTFDAALQEIWRERIIEAGQHCKMVRGSLPGELEELVESFSRGKINYRQLLRRYVCLVSGGEAHWLPPARRFVWQKTYLPSHRNPKIEIVVAVDTSASIQQKQFQVVFGEIAKIVRDFQDYELTLIQCDEEIRSVENFSFEHPLRENQPIKVEGRCGTDFNPVFEYVKKEKLNPKILLYYTDGMGDFPDEKPPYPVIWLLQDGDTKSIPWGKTVDVSNAK